MCLLPSVTNQRESVLIISPAKSAVSLGKRANKHSSALPKDVTSSTLLPQGDALRMKGEIKARQTKSAETDRRPKKVPGHKYPPFIIITKYQDI